MEWLVVVKDLKERCESYGLNLFEAGFSSIRFVNYFNK